jgi:very-short-patch-repair endonuclease
MSPESSLSVLSRLSAQSLGVFGGSEATALGVSRKQLATLRRTGAIERTLPDTYRMTSVARSGAQALRAALVWAGAGAAAAGRSAGEQYELEGVRAAQPEIVVPRSRRLRSEGVVVHRSNDANALMLRRHRGLPTTGVEATPVALAASLDEESFEIAYEDARRRRLTSVPGMRAYLDRFGRAGRPGVSESRRILNALDPHHAARSILEVKTRRLLVAHGMSNFVREFPLDWNGRRYRFDFAFEREMTILETNGRRWNDDSIDYERDNDKWSVPARHGYKIVFATWSKVTQQPKELLAELATTPSNF